MILPLISTGLKIFQATRKKASSGSEMASNIVSKKTTVTGKSVGRPKSGAIVKASSNKISGAKFLQSTTDPSKDKIKAKDGILQGIASIINMINKFLSFILKTLIGDNKLTQKQSENERRGGELALKRQRESSLEGDQDTTGVSSSKSKSKSGSFFDRIIKFISSIILGSLVLAVYRRFTDIIQFFKNAYEIIKDVFERLGEYISPIWEVFKFLVDPVDGISELIGLKPDTTDYASMIEKELEDAGVELESEQKLLGERVKEESEEMEGQDDSEATDGQDNDEISLNEGEKKGKNVIMMAIDFLIGVKRIANPLDSLALVGAAKAEAGTLDGKPIREDRSFAKGMIKEHEGLKLKVYKDTKGLLTVGYGHQIDADSPLDIRNLKEGDVISQERADQLFDMDFDDHLNAARQIPGFFKATKMQQAGLIDLTFNMGPNWYKSFPNFVKAFDEGDYQEAAKQLEYADPINRPGVKSGYVKDVGSRRSTPIIDLIEGKGIDVDISPHLKGIQNLLSSQSKNLSNKISSISMDMDFEDDSPIIIPIPKSKTKVVGGSGGNQMIVVGGEDVNSIMDKIYLAKHAKVG